MSRAFVKEQDGEPPKSEAFDLPISPHPNLLTPEGYRLLEGRLANLEKESAKLKKADRMTDRPHQDQIEREIRFLKHRLETAQVIAGATQSQDRVAFSAFVTVEDQSGKKHDYRIVGEDEADPEKGLVSYVSPLARALMDAKVGDVVTWARPAGDLELEVLMIKYA